jgi:hypothetical protein
MTFQDTLQANIAEIRTRAADFLLDTCVLYRKTGETILNGESTAVFDSGTELACRLIIRSGSESNNVASQERAIAQGIFTGLYRMQLPYGTEVVEDDKIEYVDTENGTVRTFEVLFAPPFNIYTGAYVIQLREVK